MTNEEAKNILSTLNIQGGRRNGKLLLVEASRLAIEALEKQISKKPNVICTSESLDLYDCYCPSCRLFLGSNISREYGELFKHHCECGQSLDWSE